MSPKSALTSLHAGQIGFHAAVRLVLHLQVLVYLRRTGLSGSDESRANPDGLCTPHQSSGKASAVVDAASGNHVDLRVSV